MDAAETAAWIAARSPDAPFGYVVTPNADHLTRLRRHPTLRPLYDNALLRVLDSRVVVLLGRGLGLAMPAVATGSDVTAHLLAEHASRGERVTIVGLDPAYIPALVARTGITWPAHHNPPMGFGRDPAAVRSAVDFVLANPSRFVFLAVGSPRQEALALAIAATGKATGTGLCIGSALAFLAGAEPRAPHWMQAHGLEWLFRLTRDPVRLWRRYLLDCPAVGPMLLRERFRQRV